MKIILSPARGIWDDSPPACPPASTPIYLKYTLQLVELLKDYSPWELESLLRTNSKLALEAWEHYQSFRQNRISIPALFAYHGLVYSGISPQAFTQEDLAFASDSLRILSAFYGILHPFDGIHPYRLELVSKLRPNGKNLYAFWGDKLYQALFASGEAVVNLCSAEYSKAISPYLQPNNHFITCNFLTNKQGKLRCITTSAKSARGNMARFIVQNRLQTPEALQAFHWDDYTYIPELSDTTQYTFVRS